MKYIVTAIKEREENVRYLLKMIPNLEVVWDKERNGAETFYRSLEQVGYDDAVHLEDDIILTSNFVEKIEAAISKNAEVVNQFFSMRKADLEIGSRYDSNFLAGLCWYSPPHFSKLLKSYIDSRYGKNDFIEQYKKKHDCIIQEFMSAVKQPKYWVHVPSLVDHRIGKSAVDSKRGSTNRIAKTFVKN